MTAERQDITSDFYSGDLKDIKVTVYNQDGSLRNLTGAELTYAFIYDDGKNPQTLFQKSSTDAQITLAGLGECIVHLLPADTYAIYGTYRHQLHLSDTTYEGIVMSGKVLVFRAFARRLRHAALPAYLTGSV